MALDLHNDRPDSSDLVTGCHQVVWMRCFSYILLLGALPPFNQMCSKNFDVASLSNCALLVRVDIIFGCFEN
jgi:hypothetical protein